MIGENYHWELTLCSLTSNKLEILTDLVGFFWLVAIPLWLDWVAYLAARLYEEKQRNWIKEILWTWKERTNLQENYELWNAIGTCINMYREQLN